MIRSVHVVSYVFRLRSSDERGGKKRKKEEKNPLRRTALLREGRKKRTIASDEAALPSSEGAVCWSRICDMS